MKMMNLCMPEVGWWITDDELPLVREKLIRFIREDSLSESH